MAANMAPVVAKESDSMKEDEVSVEVKKLGMNHRRFQGKVAVKASLDTIWEVLSDYEKMSDYVPGLSDSKVLDRKDNVVRICQIAQHNLPLGLKFNARMIFDCCEKDVEIFASGRRREMEFKMIEGDLQYLEGKWSIEQVKTERPENSDSSLGQEFESTLSYSSDVKSKIWLPVHLIEGKMRSNIKANMAAIQQEAQRVVRNALSTQ